ncbi:MAG TPA: VWA domain-containing protein [Acidobacteriaceae bacterium]|nr:VWA domain-containing protein [Acidobacteriaceae bacterium]
MHRRSKVWGLGLLFAALTAGAWAQTPATAAPQAQRQLPLTVDADPVPSPDPDTIPTAPATATGKDDVVKENGKFLLHENAYEVRLNASVIDGSGRTVDSLPKEAFHVYEDGVAQSILSFRHEDLPVSLGILIDSSGSMIEKKSAVDAASINLVKLSNPSDEAFLVDFNSEAYIDEDFTSDIGKLQQGLGLIHVGGGTALYDAVVASADYLSKNAKEPKQVLLLITDGDDNASSASLEQAIERVQDLDGPAIYCIGLLFGDDTDRRENRHAKEVLQELAQQTGGQAYFPRSLRDVSDITSEVAQDIRTQYTIAYRSTKPPALGGYRVVHVEAKEKGFRGLQVRTRTGYYPKVASTAPRATGSVTAPPVAGPPAPSPALGR